MRVRAWFQSNPVEEDDMTAGIVVDAGSTSVLGECDRIVQELIRKMNLRDGCLFRYGNDSTAFNVHMYGFAVRDLIAWLGCAESRWTAVNSTIDITYDELQFIRKAEERGMLRQYRLPALLCPDHDLGQEFAIYRLIALLLRELQVPIPVSST
jgi:hypothetical protein